jgi:hypothetical protein
MTDTERQQAYIDAVKALSAQYGYELQAQIVTDNLGGGILHKPQIALVAIANWQPPAPKTAPETEPQEQPKVVVNTSLLEKNYIGIVQDK